MLEKTAGSAHGPGSSDWELSDMATEQSTGEGVVSFVPIICVLL